MPADPRFIEDTTGRWRSYRSGKYFPTNPDRNSLVYGTYEPDATNTGLLTSEASLTDYNSSSVNAVSIPAGAVITDKKIYGDITFLGAAELRNCLLVGGANVITGQNAQGVLRCTNVRSGIAKLYDCRIRPRQESDNRDCALGWQYELYRCHLSGGIDGCGIYKTSSPYDCLVKIKGCLIEDLTFIYPDAWHTDYGTHNDCIQIQGGLQIEIVGNSIRGTSHALTGTGTNPTYPWWLSSPNGPWASGYGIIIQRNIAAAPAYNSTVIITDNYFSYCNSQFGPKTNGAGPARDFIYMRNKHYKTLGAGAPATSGSYGPWWIRMDDLTATQNIIGLCTNGVITNTTNVFVETGVPLTTPAANGVKPTLV